VTFNTPDPFSVQSWPRAAPSTRSSVVYAVTDVIRSFMPGRTAGSDMVLPAGVRTDGPELLRRPHREHGHVGGPHDLLGDAAEQVLLDPCALASP